MDDGNIFLPHTQSPGYDIGPDEDRADFRPVDAILGSENYSNDLHYSQVFVEQPRGSYFEEPIDEGAEAEAASEVQVSDTSSENDKKKYFIERERLKTFSKWSSAYHVTPVDLARNGFIHIGPADRVLCVFCLKTITEWESGDVVEKEHERIYPNCPFVRGKCMGLNKPLSGIENLKQDMRILQKGENAKFSAFKEEAVRLETFVNWPTTLKNCPTPAALARAGFFYKPQQGKPDRVKCFMCGKMIYKWQPEDDPWVEHARLSPHCKYILQQKGPDFLRQCTRESVSSMAQPEARRQWNVTPEESETSPVQVSAGGTGAPSEAASVKNDDSILNHAVAQAVIQEYGDEFSVEEVRRAMEDLHLLNGPETPISSMQLLNRIWQNDDKMTF